MSPLRGWLLAALLSLTPRAGPAAQAGSLQRRLPRAGWQDGRVVSQITHPSRLVGHSSGGEVQKHQLDTRVRNEPGGGGGGGGGGPGLHLAQVSFVVRAFGSAFTLDLQLNHHLLASHYVERHVGTGSNSSHSTGAGEHCYYQGRIRGQPYSFVALSSCHGLRGVFSDSRATYLIEPQVGVEHGQGLRPHVIQRVPSCAGPGEPLHRAGARPPGLVTVAPVAPCPVPRQLCPFPPGCLFPALNQPIAGGLPKLRRRRQVRRAQHTVHSETKYIELAVVNDHQLFLQLRKSVVLTSNFAKSVVNLADMIYKEQLNTRIVLVAMETWASEDRIRMGEDSLETLNEFVKYRREGPAEQSDTVHLFSGRTFQSSRSGTAFVGGICSPARAGGVNEVSGVRAPMRAGWEWGGPSGDSPVPPVQYGNVAAMAVTLAQTLGQNVGMMWNKHRTAAGDCRCPDSWLGCIMEDTGYYLPRKFSRCSIDEYNQFLQDGGGSCLFNKPLKLLDPPECGNGFVEAGEECDCGSLAECAKSGGNCCKKCTLTHDAMCSDGLCCKGCKYEPRGVSCREAVNECDIPETCTGDSSQCPPNLHKLDGYFCENEQGRCYGGRCKTRDRQCNALWGRSSAERFCYEKLNVEGTERGNCGREGLGWLQCNKQDVLCGFLLCANISGTPRLGELSGEIATTTFFHQNRYVDCRGGHVQLVDGSDLSYVEDGTPCGPGMLCLDRKCLPATAFNFSSCPGSWDGKICFDHGVCSNEGKCICRAEWTGKDCSVYDPIPEPKPTGETERYKGPSGTNIIIGSIAGAVLVAAIVLGGTGWGFKNIRRGRYDPAQQGV
ncbi:disintegrin and metalloproteinase domain-containing protein 11 isoform X1 [Accipiter gentilis]|uniref:disintegrin and metalloproteinase domain-containing protein 11 isoform X1 n=1 Tax=Astur gentilis TaxID=8957 RepID=UPI002110E1C3|nr:disintegrin and metalloproteinase domain-containing protein 11 isoform X1 [Accipiter gentilis]